MATICQTDTFIASEGRPTQILETHQDGETEVYFRRGPEEDKAVLFQRLRTLSNMRKTKRMLFKKYKMTHNNSDLVFERKVDQYRSAVSSLSQPPPMKRVTAFTKEDPPETSSYEYFDRKSNGCMSLPSMLMGLFSCNLGAREQSQ